MRSPLLLFLLLLTACGSEGPAPLPRRPGELDRRIELAADPPVDRAPRAFRTWRFPEGAEGSPEEGPENAESEPARWEVRAPLAEPRTGADGVPELGVADNSRRPVDLVLAGEHSAREIDEVHVLATFHGKGELRVAALRGDELLAEGPPVALVEALDAPALTVLRLPRELADDAVFDRLAIRMTGSKRLLGLRSLALARSEPESRLPAPGAPELVRIGGESRRAAGLSGRSDLVARAPVDGDAELAFSWGVPESARRAEGGVRLRVELRAGEASAERSFSVEAAWHEARLPVPGSGARSFEVRFSLETDGEAPALAAVGEVALVRRGPAPPPVLLVTTDTHRGDHVGRLSPELLETPLLDELAERGVQFELCFSSSNYTNPSHVALMTGTHPRDTRIVTNRQRLNDAPTTLAEHFRAAGYRTWAALSARHLRDDVSGLGQGFDRMAGPDGAERRSNETVELALTWLEARDERPVFLWLHVFDAHWPYEPVPELDRAYYDASRPREPWPPGVNLVRGAEEVDDLNYYRAQYRAEITWLDRQIRRVVEHPTLDGALVAVVGDHGESMGAHDTYFSHGGLYPDTLHVPLVLAWPGAPAGTRVGRRVRQIDLGRTLLELTGLPAGGFGGSSLVADLGADPGADGEQATFALDSSAVSVSLTEGTTHFVLHLEDNASILGGRRAQRGDVELYDLAADPGCTVDLSGREPERAAALRERARAWLAERAEFDWRGSTGVSAEVGAQLEALGYTGGR